MADQRHRHVSEPASHPTERLLATMVGSCRTGAQATLAMTPHRADGARLEREVETIIGRRVAALPHVSLEAETRELIQRTSSLLLAAPEEGFRAETYIGGIGLIDDARNAAQATMSNTPLAGDIHAAVVWFSVWHLCGASLSVDDILRIVSPPIPAQMKRPSVPPPPPVRARISPIIDAQPTGSSTWKMALDVAGRTARRSLAKMQEMRVASAAIQREVAKARDERLKAVEASRREARARYSERSLWSSASIESSGPTTDSPTTYSAIALDGPRMRSPVFGTWLMLVVLSWVALFWGAMLAIPFVGPFALLGAMMGGFIAVPVWGTLWGFIGMGAAKASTLHQMGFREASPDDWLATTTKALAARLDLPAPQIGTIPAINAFAMGSDHRHATVAIGKPLLERLNPDEVAAVIGHELGHVVSGDMRKMMLMRTFQNACVWYMLSQGLRQFMRWVICWVAELAILAFSRRREYWADAVGAALTSKEAMIGALRKIEHAPTMTASEVRHGRFMFRGAKSSALSTHPSVADRITALQAETYLKRLPVKR